MLVAITVLISVILLIIADVYSEKLVMASVLCLIAGLSALVSGRDDRSVRLCGWTMLKGTSCNGNHLT